MLYANLFVVGARASGRAGPGGRKQVVRAHEPQGRDARDRVPGPAKRDRLLGAKPPSAGSSSLQGIRYQLMSARPEDARFMARRAKRIRAGLRRSCHAISVAAGRRKRLRVSGCLLAKNRFVALVRGHLWFHSIHERVGMNHPSGECRLGMVTCKGGMTNSGAGV